MLPSSRSYHIPSTIQHFTLKVGYRSVPVSPFVFMPFLVMDLQRFWKVESPLMITAFADIALEWPGMVQDVFTKTQVSVVKFGGLRSYFNSS